MQEALPTGLGVGPSGPVWCCSHLRDIGTSILKVTFLALSPPQVI